MPQHTLPLPPFAPGARVIVLEAAPGRARRQLLEAWAEAARRQRRTAAWVLPCDAERGGLWAGLGSWIAAILPDLDARAPELFNRHDAEIVAVLPVLRRRVCPHNVTLTDRAEKDEGVRNYARDRAFRLGHGVVDLLDEWHTLSGDERWVVACDDYDRKGALVGRFFQNLVRRRGEKMSLVLLAAVAPGEGERAAAELAPYAAVERVRLELEAGPDERLDPAEAAGRAAAMEEWVGRDTLTILSHGHQVARLWRAAGREDRETQWHAVLMGIYAHMGYYEDAFRHAAPVRAGLHWFDEDARFYTRAKVVGNLRIVYVTNALPEEAREVLESEGLAKLTDPQERAKTLYLLSMLHARHLPVRDQDAAERCLHQALAEAERAELPDDEKHFLTGFLLNGLAYVRFRQGDARAAADLTESNRERLDTHLAPERHRLHRSVLLYNAGQVYAQTGDHDQAIRYYSEAMEMDPNYSEYYNDRGNLYLKLGRLDEAEADYRRAIELSAPYPEVWFNLGQCLTGLKRLDEAEAAYERALDLDPARPEAWATLARTRQALGRRGEALSAYDQAVAADGSNAFVLANRAALRFELGRPEESLDDLDRAVALLPDHPGLRRNRELLLAALGRTPEVPQPALV